ncbi:MULTISPECIES: hypothetical protein [Mycolicibacterium]|uniref:Uncharacterized protein n=2 Tax=Mycolicibacterium TaxID=1866885 RepID=A0A6N4UP71_9MYCO|nr:MULTISPECIES: hypothetical protein [Mycolicibacterium]MBP2451666.1 hypothetical protein [Mycolicibacterium lutetiense]MCV6999427.1 hypothetical protein [Mycolicibacterium alvei]BBX25331.1 hypothetical protein MALV_04560 [Mycolicibacterium alvei]
MTNDWNDFRGELDADQQAQVEGLSRMDHPRRDEMLVAYARSLVQENLLQTWLADVPVPAGAVSKGSEWIDDGASVYRFFDGTARGDVKIVIQQWDDDRAERVVFAGKVPDPCTADQAREWGKDMIAAAAEIERHQ